MTEFWAVKDEEPLRLHEPLAEGHKQASLYKPAAGLKEAFDIAMMLGVPLLLTGDPGVGKTRAAYWLATQLGAPLLRFDVKSNTAGSDLLYYFDEVARFRDSSRKEPRPLVHYLRFNGLGKAILAAIGGGAPLFTSAGEPLAGAELARRRELLTEAFGEAGEAASGEASNELAIAPLALLLPDEKGFADAKPEHWVALIDELDKAPRDTPNDLLVEVEEMEFNIPELGLKVRGVPKPARDSEALAQLPQDERRLLDLCARLDLQPSLRPIVIVTSNSEKSLPDPFLRRCAYFDIPFPKEDAQLIEIIDDTIPALSGGGTLVEDALGIFRRLRRPQAVSKAPGTAELLAWLDILVRGFGLDSNSSLRQFLSDRPDDMANSLAAVIKQGTDSAKAAAILRDWASGKGPNV